MEGSAEGAWQFVLLKKQKTIVLSVFKVIADWDFSVNKYENCSYL